MSEARLEFCIGNVSFAGEGQQDWLAEQMGFVLEVARARQQAQPSGSEAERQCAPDPEAGSFTDTLATHLKRMNADESQKRKFLIVADWLRLRDISDLRTNAVTKSLRENQQKRLTNASDSLNKNVMSGYCEKKGDGFFITSEGLRFLGYDA